MAGFAYIGVKLFLVALFIMIVMRTFGRRNMERGEAPKYRMLHDDEERG